MKESKFKRKAPSQETVKKRATQSGGGFDSYIKGDVPKYKVSDGKNTVRIISAPMINKEVWGDEGKWGDSWGIVVWIHYGIGTDTSTYLCPLKMNKDPCPICESLPGIATDDEEKAKELKPGPRVLAYVIDRDDEKAGPLVWAMPQSKVEKEIQMRSLDEDQAMLDITDPDEGYDITFTKEGKEKRTTYAGINVARKPSSLSDNPKVQEQWLEFVVENPLPEVLVFYDYKHLEAVYMGKKSTKDEAEDASGDEGGGKKAEKKGSKKKPEPEGVTRTEVAAMDEDELKQLIEDQELDVDPEDFPTEKSLRKAVIAKMEEDEKFVDEAEENADGEGDGEVPEEGVKLEDIMAMDEEELTKLNETYGLDLDLDSCANDKAMRKAVVNELKEHGKLIEEDDPEPDPKPAKPKSGKEATGKANASVDRLKRKQGK